VGVSISNASAHSDCCESATQPITITIMMSVNNRLPVNNKDFSLTQKKRNLQLMRFYQIQVAVYAILKDLIKALINKEAFPEI
jgi:hypothetical protein